MSADDKTRILPDMANTDVGTQLSGIYELDERIASGGMGEVYRGHNIQTGDHVAIKIVLPEFARDQTILSLFRKEASILNHLSHDAIVRYHVFTIDPGIGRPYLAMEFVDGESLFDIIRRGPMPIDDVRRLCHRLASGLSFVHEAGAVHRDLSPDNVILPGGRVERAKIIDFGIARSATVGGETLIGGKFAGKYNYVSPEQLGLCGGEVSERSDIYSLGLVLAAVLRGKPLEMSGSQFEIVEKRRSIPDLSDLDGDLRPMIEAMLEPDPADRPTAAEIAKMTRDDVDLDGTLAPRSASPRDRSTLKPQTTPPAPLDPWVDPNLSEIPEDALAPASPPRAEEPSFVPHMRPAHLSQPRRPATASPAHMPSPKRPTQKRNIAIASAAAAILLLGGGAYLSGFLTSPPATDTGEISQLTPNLSAPPKTETAAPDNQAAESTAPTQTQAETPDPSLPANQTDIATAQGEDAPPPTDKVADTPAPPIEKADVPVPPVEKSVTSNEQSRVAIQAPESNAKTVAPETPAQPSSQTDATDTERPQADVSVASKTETPAPIPSTGEPDSVNQPTRTDEQQPANSEQQETTASEQQETTTAMNVPKPEIPATDAIDGVAERISWLRDYSGGDCFYASATSATDKAIEIEGFGTAVEPFMQMMEAFRGKFDIEPDVNVRLIEPAQCQVTQFLRALGATAADKPHLTLDRTSVPNGSPISGTLETLGGLKSSLILIDHKGMAFNLDERIIVQSGKATFSIPIGLGASDQAAGKAVPQIILAVTGASDIATATFSNPTPAAVALPKILAEIQEKGLEFSATAKYFRLGG